MKEPAKRLVCATSDSNCISWSARKSLKQSATKELQILWYSIPLCFQTIQLGHLHSQKPHLATSSIFDLADPLVAVAQLYLARLPLPPPPPSCYRSCVIILFADYLFLISCWRKRCISTTLIWALFTPLSTSMFTIHFT